MPTQSVYIRSGTSSERPRMIRLLLGLERYARKTDRIWDIASEDDWQSSNEISIALRQLAEELDRFN